MRLINRDSMSVSDDSGPISSRAKRRKFSVRSAPLATKLEKEITAVNTGSSTVEPSIQLFSNKEEFDAMIVRMKEAVLLKRQKITQLSGSTRQEIENLRSELSSQKERHRCLELQLASNLEEMNVINAELTGLENGFEWFRKATDAQDEDLKQASENIESLQDVARTSLDLLHRTTIKSKEDSILNMLRSLSQDLAREHLGPDGIVLPNAAESGPAALRELDEDTKHDLLSLLRGLRTHKSYQVFAQPVTEEEAPKYFEVVKRPMDLSTIRRKLESNLYTSLSDFSADARLMFDNCRTYNGDASRYTEAANRFEQQMRYLMEKRGLKGL
jgi:Bromodomain